MEDLAAPQLRRLKVIISEKKFDLEHASDEINILVVSIENIFAGYIKELAPIVSEEYELIKTAMDIFKENLSIIAKNGERISRIYQLEAEDTQRSNKNLPPLHTEELNRLRVEQAEPLKIVHGPGGEQITEHLVTLQAFLSNYYQKPLNLVTTFRKKWSFFKVKWILLKIVFFFLSVSLPFAFSKEIKELFDIEGYWVEVCIAVIFLFTYDKISEGCKQSEFWRMTQQVLVDCEQTHTDLSATRGEIQELKNKAGTS